MLIRATQWNKWPRPDEQRRKKKSQVGKIKSVFVLVGADEMVSSSASALRENNTTVMLPILCQPTAVEEVRRGGGGGGGGGRGTAGIEKDKTKNTGAIH